MLMLIKIKNIIRDKEGRFTIIKPSMYQENITTLNVYMPCNRTSKYTGKNWQTEKRNRLMKL